MRGRGGCIVVCLGFYVEGSAREGVCFLEGETVFAV